uniref:Protein HIRA n=1 Tax=Timema poppense TaxID=170557 RepID=A0A7R9DJ58_TIMPO|nr:unnamed protein product [Timema poppensis]
MASLKERRPADSTQNAPTVIFSVRSLGSEEEWKECWMEKHAGWLWTRVPTSHWSDPISPSYFIGNNEPITLFKDVVSMKLLKPHWVTHDGVPIFSIDIHPDGSRFATGGQGKDSGGRIVIWNMGPVISEEAEKNESHPKMLCQMDNHLACVNCVRWNSSGKFLASGGDDKLIMIWKISQSQTGSSSVFGSGGKVNVETWRCNFILRGHGGDVLDLAWSPHDAWLASCSVDNTVIVWNALKMPEMIAILKGHTGLVKGVVWDPIGKYIASQSDDKTLRIWRTADWKQDAVIHEPFEECGGTTHVLRLSWSPDGLYLVSAHAMNGGGPTAQIVEREGWRQDKDFVGHRKAVTCVRFNSNILQKSYKSSTKPQQYCCCAIGSRDRSLSVWLTSLKRPLIVIHDLFNNSVLDMSWSFSNHRLMACSWDGTVAYIEFSEEELGKCLTIEEKNTLHERMYGKNLSASLCQTSVVECSDLIGTTIKSEILVLSKTTNHSDHVDKPVVPTSPMKGPINKQIETRTSDGKRRITPMYIPPAPDSIDVPVPFGSASSQPTFSSSSEPKSRILIEKRDDIVKPNVTIKTSYTSPQKVVLRTDYQLPNKNSKDKGSSLESPTLWEAALSGKACIVGANKNFVAVACKDATLHIINTNNGCRILPPIVLSSSTSRLSINSKQHVMVLTSNGEVSVWDILENKVLVKNELIPTVHTNLSKNISIDSFSITEKGIPMLSLSNGNAFFFSPNLSSWLEIGNHEDSLQHSLTHSGIKTLPTQNITQFPLTSLHSYFQTPMSGHFFHNSSLTTIMHFEQLLSVCLVLDSKAEYHHCLLLFVKFLVQEGLEQRLRVICDDFLGPIHSLDSQSHVWVKTILGFPKHTLLKEVLEIVKANLKLQRLYMEYTDQLMMIEARGEEEEAKFSKK